jgi:hypothetical protein
MDHSVKITDVASILTQILDLPFPFSNMGVGHPVFSPTSDISQVHKKFIDNLTQMNGFI